MLQAAFNYMTPMSEQPFYYQVRPPEGTPVTNVDVQSVSTEVHDARDLVDAPSLDREGYSLTEHVTAVGDLRDHDRIRAEYYPEMEALVAEATGAGRVVAFDHNVRRGDVKRQSRELRPPVPLAHNDYTIDSGPQRVRDLMGKEAADLLRGRVAVINVWKPIVGPVRSMPLAVCQATTMSQQDFVATELRYADRTGEIYSVTHRDTHRWYYYSAMTEREAMLLKCYDSDPSVSRFTAHSAFADPTTPDDASPRESIEVRTLAFF